MKTAGIIAEYNPFHKGHQYQIQYARQKLGAQFVIVAMSGDYVQRGTPALFPKHLRTETALRCGADLVLELPVSVSTASAEFFAKGGVSLLDSIGVTDMLCFGSESGEIPALMELAKVLTEEPQGYRLELKNGLAAGFSYPQARSLALTAYYKDMYTADSEPDEALLPLINEMTHILNSPNNILGIEYCKALLACKSSMKPVTLKRHGHGYHSTELTDGIYASASAIRKGLLESNPAHAEAADNRIQAALTQIPAEIRPLLTDAIQKQAFVTESDLDSILHYCLLSHRTFSSHRYLDLSPDLEKRIRNRMGEYNGFQSFCELLKTKELTYTRIQRALLHVILNIHETPEQIPYARVLGFRRDSSSLLTEMAKKSSIPIITKYGDAAQISAASDRSLLEKTIFASGLYEGILARKTGQKFIHEWKRPIVIV